MFKNTLAVLSLLFVSQVQASDYLEAIADQHIIPVYAELKESTMDLSGTVRHLCVQPSVKNLDQTKVAYQNAFLSWQGAQHIRFGPIQVLLRMHRYQHWPDKRGSVGKHLRKFIAANDVTKLEQEVFANASVSIQGFSALERLLFNDKGIEQYQPDIQCELMLAIANNLQMMSNDMYEEWTQGKDSYRHYVVTAEQGNMVFEELSELQSMLLNNLYTELQLVAEQKFERPLGKSLKKAKSKRAEAWRSELSKAAIAQNLQSSKDLYVVAYAPLLKGQKLHDQILSGFDQAITDTQGIRGPLFEAVKDEKQRAQVKKAQASVHLLKRLIGRDMAEKLQLSVGFNSLDGD